MITSLYKLQYDIEDIEPALNKIIAFINTPLDVTNPTELITKREEGRLLLSTASKCCLTINYRSKRVNSRSTEEYAVFSSLKEYCEMIKKDLENTLVSINNTVNYYKNER